MKKISIFVTFLICLIVSTPTFARTGYDLSFWQYPDESDIIKGTRTYLVKAENYGFIINDFCSRTQNKKNFSQILQIQKINPKTKKKEFQNISMQNQVKDKFIINSNNVYVQCKNAFVDHFAFIPTPNQKKTKARFAFVKGTSKELEKLIGKWNIPRKNLDVEATGDGFAFEFWIKVDANLNENLNKASKQVSNDPVIDLITTNINSETQPSPTAENESSKSTKLESSTKFNNPYNTQTGRYLPDGTFQLGQFYGSANQLANDLITQDLSVAALNVARNESEARQICVASNLSTGDIGSATRC